MDLSTFPAEIHDKILRYLDIKQFMRVACTCRTFWNRCETLPKKYWNVKVEFPRSEGPQISQAIITQPYARPMTIPSERTIDFLLRDATVLGVQTFESHIPGLTSHKLAIGNGLPMIGLDPLPVLKAYKPTGKYETVGIHHFNPYPELVEFINENVANLVFHPDVRLPECLDLKVKTMQCKLSSQRRGAEEAVEFVVELVMQWNDGAREIESISVQCPELLGFGLAFEGLLTRQYNATRGIIIRVDNQKIVIDLDVMVNNETWICLRKIP